MNREISKTSREYIWFWIDVTTQVWKLIFSNQVQFWDKIFEILWHGNEEINIIKETLWNVLKEKWLIFFKIQENTETFCNWDEYERRIKYKILEILDI